MATIQTSIQLQDGMSRQFAAINTAMMSTIDYMQQLNTASADMFDTSALDHAQRELQQMESYYNQLEQEILQSDHAQGDLNRTISQGEGAAKGLLGAIGAIAGTYLSLQAIGDVINLSDQMTDTTARVQLLVDDMPIIPDQSANVNLNLNGMSEVEQANQLIFESAQRSYSSFKDTADMVSRIGSNARDSFGSISEVVAFTELVQKQFGIAGANAVEASNATIQLSQALASGVLRGDELASIFEQAPNLIHTIADYMGEPIGRIRELASEGVITADIVKNAMFAASDEINNKFNSMPTTWSQIWTTFKNDALWAFKDILAGINGIANSERFKSFMADVGIGIQRLAGVATGAFAILTTAGAFVYDNWSLIGPIIGGATIAMSGYVAALGAVKLASMASSAWTAINTTATLIYAAAMGAGTGSTWAMVTAAWGLNSALWANPIFLIVAGVFALIAALYVGVAVFNHFANESYSATGMVIGAFAVLGAYIYNSVAYMWNIFAAFFEFIVNIAQGRTFAIRKLFYDLANNVLDHAIAMADGWDKFATGFANGIIDAVNIAIKAWNWFVDMLPDSVASAIGLQTATEFTHRTSIVSDLNGLKGRLDDWLGEMPSDYWEAPKMEYIAYSDAWNTGYDWGENLFNFDNKGQEDNEAARRAAEQEALMQQILNGVGQGVSGIGDSLAAAQDTASNTAQLADSMELSEDEIKYLRDAAVTNSINRYTTEIKVDMKNENHIHHDTDIDGIVDRFGEKVEEVVAVLAEGDNLDV